MRHAMWMGTRGYEMWVPMPKISVPYSRSGFTAASPQLNGGTTLRQSKGGHNVYAFEWNNGARDDVMPVRDIADGIYDTHDGVNLVYFLDPMAADRNLLPAHWAAPALGAEDAPSLDARMRPTTALQSPSSFRLPARAATFQPISTARKLYVPIPPGFAAWFGWIGSGSGVQIAAATASGAGDPQTPAGLPGTGTWTNAVVQRNGATTGVEISLAGGSTPTIRAMTLQILPAGRVPRANVHWSGGLGNSGCQFQDKAGLTPLSVALDLVAATATLEETGDWL